MSMNKKIRHLQRYHHIAAALMRNGFGFLIHDLGLPNVILKFQKNDYEEKQKHSVWERIRHILEDLGPTYVKLGQIASTRPDLLPAELIMELQQLQDKVAPFPYDDVERIIKAELGASIDSLFQAFDKAPIASASIGQVHEARLWDGTAVAVKVQRPRIAANMATDLEMLKELAAIAERHFEWASSYRLQEVVAELARSLKEELDYSAEAENGKKFAKTCAKHENVHVPVIYSSYSTRKVLTMQLMKGIKLSDLESLTETGIDKSGLAYQYASLMLHQILIDGVFHGDPHPGNVLVLQDGSLCLLDFGMVGRLSINMKSHFASLVIALRNKSSKGILRAISKMGIVPEDADEDQLLADIDKLRDKYYEIPLSDVSIGESVNDLLAVAFRHQIRMPVELTVLGKALLTLEGVVTMLDPAISIIDVAEPYGRRLFLEQLNPVRIGLKWMEEIPDFIELLSQIPKNLKKLSTILQRGKLKLDITTPELAQVLNKMDQITNKISLSIVLLSFSIIMVGLIIGSAISNQHSEIWNFPIVEIGLSISGILALWLIFAIFRSGRF
ncbi:ABC1 kinase family protein [Paenibacillus sp. GXUN7292]|uniref:ABC1 kinase family protein n=1 Tax=Paenibacillus sp. GXUN7292 TaxID=3422499 RepID=UPI003D7DBC6A